MEMLKTGLLFGIGFTIGSGAVTIALSVGMMLVGMLMQ